MLFSITLLAGYIYILFVLGLTMHATVDDKIKIPFIFNLPCTVQGAA